MAKQTTIPKKKDMKCLCGKKIPPFEEGDYCSNKSKKSKETSGGIIICHNCFMDLKNKKLPGESF